MIRQRQDLLTGSTSNDVAAEVVLPVDLKIIEQTLVDKCGRVVAAAQDLGMPSGDLRRLVASRPLVADAIYEGVERALDAAEKTLLDGMEMKIR